MNSEIRQSGITPIGGVPWGSHFCQFYETKQDLIDTLVPYFKAGLVNNEFCMWITADNLTADEARAAISKAIPGFAGLEQKGQIEILPYDTWYLENGRFDSQRVLDGWVEKTGQALEKGYAGLRLSGNTFWLEKQGEILIGGAIHPTQIVICVSDQGPGIAPDDIPHVFDRFYRATQASRTTKGAGLGLYLARAVVEAHGGRIWVDPGPNSGARICFSLPRDEKDLR